MALFVMLDVATIEGLLHAHQGLFLGEVVPGVFRKFAEH